MGKLITIVGVSGIGKTTLTRALEHAYPFETAYEQHNERPFQALFKQDSRYALANQMDYLILRAEQEHKLRLSSNPALMDGGLDLDFHGFTRLFHARGFLTDPEFDLCRRFYSWTRSLLPLPDLIIHLTASRQVVEARLRQRNRINIARLEDFELLNSFLNEWLETIPASQILRLDVSEETVEYLQSIPKILAKIQG
jgi:deoxyadenosine/deoxycytidine kinase